MSNSDDDEVARLKALLANAEERASKAEERATSLAAKLAKAERRLHQLERQLFGRKSERLDPRQLQLEFDAAYAEACEAPPPLEDEPYPAEELEELVRSDDPEETPRKRRRRLRFPEDLEVIRDEEIHPPANERVCACGCTKVRMGEETSRRLALQPQRFYWREQVRVKYACPSCREISRPPLPPAPIEKSLADTPLLVEVLLSKYADHLPLDRLERIYSREGVQLTKQTLWSWIESITDAPLLGAIADAVGKEVCARSLVQTDETGVLVLDRQQAEGRFKGRMWVFCGEPGELFYEYTPTKETRWPKARLEGFRGILQADAYPGFDALFEDGEIVEAGCSAHARRKFKEVLDAEPKRREAAYAVVAYKKLFKVEREAKERGLDPAGRLALRRERSQPIVDDFYRWLEALHKELRPSDPLYTATRYALNHKDALTRFLQDGRIELDNNRSERSLRQVAVGRKNWLFAGSPRGAEAAATAYTLIMSCRELGVPVREYLNDVLERVSTHPASRVHELTPRAWQIARQQAAATE